MGDCTPTDGEDGTRRLRGGGHRQHCYKYVVFDVLTRSEFEVGVGNKLYSERKEQLKILGEKIFLRDIKNIEVIPFLYEGTDYSQIAVTLNYAKINNLKGSVVNLDKPYVCKKTKDVIYFTL